MAAATALSIIELLFANSFTIVELLQKRQIIVIVDSLLKEYSAAGMLVFKYRFCYQKDLL
ncbi:hypothetical protein ACT3TI_00695 [Psychrobacter sp. AOP22-C1-22]|uniref:hypothetical protein n=1 Tax=unclassified Psychrobacter TaxID=196806 RepID=UPI00178810F9|nr:MULTISPECIES: hypothetical protein [unclassified Psychrobacter]MBE0405500.1 hypothetical protein [Psychrobacter sp. FME6]MBE0444069.1 hypothetical protein [Psychrobacter sp. FME5]